MTDSSLSPLASTGDWKLYASGRGRQYTAGLLSAILLVVAFTVLVDGLVSQMRGGGSYRIEMLIGSSEPVSGPMNDSNATASDMEAFPIPKDAPLSFEFDGFFSSYWFGTGMWRGRIIASETAPSGTYGMAIGLKGTPASAHQTYTIALAATQAEQDAQSLSFTRRWTSWNPFIVAAILGAIGLGAGLGAYLLGRRCDALVADLGLSEIFKTVRETNFVRVYTVTGKREIEGRGFDLYSSNMSRLGKVIFDRTEHGCTECLFVPGSGKLPRKGDLVAFWQRREHVPSPARRGLFRSAPGHSSVSVPPATCDREQGAGGQAVSSPAKGLSGVGKAPKVPSAEQGCEQDSSGKEKSC